VRPPLLLFKGFLGRDDIVFDDVIAQNHADFFVLDERFRKPKGVGNAALTLLVCVMNTMQPEFPAVGEKSQEIAGILPACNDDDFSDSGVDQGLDRIVDHRSVIDWQ